MRALAAEVICGELARALGLPMPLAAILDFPAVLARAEPDEEIQELLRKSAGDNYGIDYLPGSSIYDPAAGLPVAAKLASRIVWFDALITNIDRTAKNTNLLVWHGHLWLIDHGAALYVHHTWDDPAAHARTRFSAIAKHVLLPFASELEAADRELRPQVTRSQLEAIVAMVPEDWLVTTPAFADAAAVRGAYVTYLLGRVAAADDFVKEAADARAAAL